MDSVVVHNLIPKNYQNVNTSANRDLLTMEALKRAKIKIRKEIKQKILSYDVKKMQYESQWVADRIRKLPQYQSAKVLN